MAESRTEEGRPTPPGKWIVVDTGCTRNYLCCRSCAPNRPSSSTPDITGSAAQQSHPTTPFTFTSNSSPDATQIPPSGLDEFKFTFNAPVCRAPDPTCFSENCWAKFWFGERCMHLNGGDIKFDVLIMCRASRRFDDRLEGGRQTFPHGPPPPSPHSPALEHSSSDEEYLTAHEDEVSPGPPPSDEEYYTVHEDEDSPASPPSDEEYWSSHEDEVSMDLHRWMESIYKAHQDEDSLASPPSGEEYWSAHED